MPWQCDCCGWENPIDDRIGRQEPLCIRCGRPPGSRAATIAELEETIGDLEHDEKGSRSRAHNLQDYISSLESEISELSIELNDVLSEITETRSELKVARARLAALQAYEPGTRYIAEDQRTLDEVRAGAPPAGGANQPLPPRQGDVQLHLKGLRRHRELLHPAIRRGALRVPLPGLCPRAPPYGNLVQAGAPMSPTPGCNGICLSGLHRQGDPYIRTGDIPAMVPPAGAR